MEEEEEVVVSYDARENLSRYLLGNLLSTFTGDRVDRIISGKPSQERFFIGTLSPREQNPQSWKKYASPTEVGVEVLLPPDAPDSGRLLLEFEAAFWYRVFPSYEEQLSDHDGALIRASEDDDDNQDGGEDEGEADGSAATPTLQAQARQLKRVWRKAGPFKVSAEIPVPEIRRQTNIQVSEADQLAILALQQWRSDQAVFRPMRLTGQTVMQREASQVVPAGALTDSQAFSTYIAANYNGRARMPQWSSGARVKVSRRRDGYLRVTVVLENTLVEASRPVRDIDNVMFETGVSVKAEGFSFGEYVVDRLRDSYRYKGDVPGAGINCFAEEGERGPRFEVRTRHAPIFEQLRIAPKLFDASIGSLCTDPVPQLQRLRGMMESYAADLEGQLEVQRPTLSREGLAYFEEDVRRFRRELARFSEGVRVLSEEPTALEAFKLTNMAFSMSSKGFENWRRFQIVFFVMIIPDLVSTRFTQFQNMREEVDLIYFPTGGGKTEAYLSAVVFQAFFDRLNGKKAGVSAFTRFPLRLLSLQQIQRIADVFGAAEKLRRKHEVIGRQGYDAFSTGYFVGGDNTPNFLFKPSFKGNRGVDAIAPLIQDPGKGDKYKIIERCPFCGERDVQVVADADAIRIRLTCPACGELPVYLSDDEIYRYLPTFIIGTLDKMTASAWRMHFRHIFGQVSHLCPDHGYVSGGKCIYSGPNNRCTRDPSEYTAVKLDDPTPSLIIQDELHLIRESLGCYDSHYETFLDSLEEAITHGAKRPKVIGATATINNPDDQIWHLYMRRGSYFPTRGPDTRESFYYERDGDKVARFIIGVLPHNRTVIHAIQEIIFQHQLMIQLWESYPSALVEAGLFANSQGAKAAISDYAIALSYNLQKMQGDQVGSAVRRILNPRLTAQGGREIRVEQMTGDVTFEQVKRVLAMLQKKGQDRKIDLITATNMISHGVDIDRLNFMVFQGMPSNTAEYVQAYSRVGRKYPGIAIVVFKHMGERDQGHYKFFRNFHSLSDLLVEPVPINRWAKFSVERTLPGIFVASLMCHFDGVDRERGGGGGLHMSGNVRQSIMSGRITEEEITGFILRCYRVDDDDMGAYFRRKIQEGVRSYIGMLTTPSESKFVPFALPESGKPLTSLRDTDVQVEVTTTKESYDPMLKVSSSRTGVSD
jgi:hypothetical protein